jgi:predicted O-methyltransferase YrrM
MNRKRIIDLAFTIPGLYSRPDAELLVNLARREGELVELGCYKGRTTALITQACQDKGGRLTSIDPFIRPGARYEASSAAMWRDNLIRVGIKPPRLMEMTGDEAIERFEGKELSFIFIDANHAYEAVLNDLRRWTPLLKVGGVVALHDMYHPGIPGVCLAVADWFATEAHHRFRWLDQKGLTIAFERRQA